MTDRLAELGALRYAAENTATHATSPNRLAAAGYIHAAFAEYQTWAAANPGVNPSRLSAKGRIFGYFYDNATFSPLSLFASGEQGAWFDPSDLSTMFQDSAGTLPVTADGQPVGKILDKSGRGNHASQATASSRPLYKTDGTYHWLQFDGVDDYLSTSTVDLSATNKASICVGVRKSASSVGLVVETSTSFYTNNGSLGILAGDSGGSNYIIGCRGTNLSYYLANGFAAPITNVVTALVDLSGATNALSVVARVDGNVISSGGSGGTAGGGNFTAQPLYIGNRSGAALNGNIYSLILRGAHNTAQEVIDTESYIAGKSGIFF